MQDLSQHGITQTWLLSPVTPPLLSPSSQREEKREGRAAFNEKGNKRVENIETHALRESIRSQ